MQRAKRLTSLKQVIVRKRVGLVRGYKQPTEAAFLTSSMGLLDAGQRKRWGGQPGMDRVLNEVTDSVTA